MSAPHFFADDVGADIVTLTGEEAAHAVRVLRVRVGERITVSDGRGTVADARVVDAGAMLRAEVTARNTIACATPVLIVFPAVPKSGKLEAVVQKLTEIGVDAIRPWFAARTVVRWDTRKIRAHGDRLRAVAREAAKQSCRARLCDVADPGSLTSLPAVTVVLHEEATERLSQVLPRETPEEIGVVIGPEGGLAPEEVAMLRERGASLATLGPQILRTETAAVIAPALVLARYDRIG